MSGLFQRIARRPADSSDGASVPEADATGQAIEAPATSETSTPPSDPPATAEMGVPALEAPIASEAPTTVQPAVSAPPPADAGAAGAPAAAPAPAEVPPGRRPGFRERGRMRRRLRYLRRLRELQVRDLGGLVFDLRRFERKRDDLVAQKIDQMRACDDELQALELALDERRDLRDVHEPGIGGTCPRCFAIYGSTDHFCATCGAARGGAVLGPSQVATAPAPSPPVAAPPASAPPAQQQ